MGRPKHLLEWNEGTVLQHVAKRLQTVCAEVCVIAAPDQETGPTPPGVRILRDDYPGQGPLAALATGLRQAEHDIVYLSGCDCPLLQPDLVRRLIDSLAAGDALVMPFIADSLQPLNAVYRRALAPRIEQLLQQGERRPRALAREPGARRLKETDFLADDPLLESFLNMNSPEQYEQLLRMRL